ncbi:MAG TPA: OmpA family protein [Burkholderiales bacterium]|nr:OmpA family protein [Burkholderiales bacterium]
MRPGTNRLLMLLVGAAIAGCAGQTERTSSGAGATQSEVEYERVGGTTNAVTQEELERRAAAKAAAEQAAPAPEPERESVQYIDTPLEETPPPAAAAPAAVKDEALPDFPITKYELPEEQASEEVEDLGPMQDESVSEAQEPTPEQESTVGEPTQYADEEPAPAEEQSAEVEDLGTQPDESGTVSYPEDVRPAPEKVVGEPTIYPDEQVAPATPAAVSVNFETEPLFNFDKAQVRTDQQTKLDELIASLASADYDSVSVVGHTDRIGTDAYNKKLSERRAESVKSYLVSKGIPAGKIQSEGRGKGEPVTAGACDKVHGRKAVISCLQPDRRVEVSVSATKQ